MPILVMKDEKSKHVFSHVVPKKGASVAYCVQQTVRNLEQLGYPKMVLKCDQEPAMEDLRNTAIKECKLKGIEAIPEESLVGASQSNGVIERAIQEIEGMVRTLKDQVEAKYQQHIKSEHPFLVWLVRHAGDLWSKYHLGVDGKTPYERLRGKEGDLCYWLLCALHADNGQEFEVEQDGGAMERWSVPWYAREYGRVLTWNQ